MIKKYYETIGETLYEEILDNQLKVYILPKVGYKKTYGLFTTKFGSIDRTFIPKGEKDYITVPDGVAHFLEHKMFDMKDGDASEKFESLGASTNAFTSNTRTCYLFQTTQNVEECVELLLDFVQELSITHESVEKENGIIIQEIGMYDDNPDWQSYFGTIRNMYVNHPIKIDIAGSAESVNSIDKDILETCYNTFYHPSNMMLFITGNVDPEALIKIIRENQDKKEFTIENTIQRKLVDEPVTVDKPIDIKHMNVSTKKASLAYKVTDILTDTKERLKRELSMQILMDIFFSQSSSFYEDGLESGIINDSFEYTFIQERDYSFIFFGIDTLDTDAFYNYLETSISNIKTINEEDLNRIKRNNIGSFITLFNSLDTIANVFSRYYLEGYDMLSIVDEYQKITLDNLYNVLPLFDKKKSVKFMID